MGVVNEFKEFAMRGNVLDMAVGVIIGAAFGKIVTSFVNDIIMPPIGLLLGKADFSNLSITLRQSKIPEQVVTLKYGMFVNTVLDFLIVAFAIFMLVKQVNRFKKKEDTAGADPTSKECPKCFSEINIKATRCPNCTAEI
jgi:large conductance mechanosensitive channel